MLTQKIKEMIDGIDGMGLSPNVHKAGEFFDEPRFYYYSTQFKIQRKYTDGSIRKDVAGGSGFSLVSPEKALFTSICEEIERFSLYCYKKDKIKYIPYEKTNKSFISAPFLNGEFSKKQHTIGWVEGEELITHKRVLVPAQLVYLNYIYRKGEYSLDFTKNTSGAAAGATKEHAILNGIYEVIERDSFMTFYLNKITPKKVNLSELKNKDIDNILQKCQRYKLELEVFDVATDMGIPVYIGVIQDKTGMGPAISVGAKAGLNKENTIMGAITESLMVRMFVKYMMIDGSIYGKGDMGHRRIFAERAAYWLPTDKIKEISFLVSGENVNVERKKKTMTIEEELSEVLGILEKRNLSVYATDVSIDGFKKMGVFVYKVLIPKLQPLYLHEEEKGKVINSERLKEVSDFFGVRNRGVNTIPHPFL